jgi:hypothetical protein
MTLGELDDFSIGFAERRFLIPPDWFDFARSGRSNGADDDHLIVEVPAPSGADPALAILIRTDNQAVTIGFDDFHTHSFRQVNIPLHSDAQKFIASVLSEELAAVSEWHAEVWRGSWMVDRVDALDLDSPTGSGWRIRERSWNGSRDQDLPV